VAVTVEPLICVLQPLPLNTVGVRPAGTVSVIVTRSLWLRRTDIAYCERVVVGRVTLLENCRVHFADREVGHRIIGVTSLAELLELFVSPPPDTCAVLVTLADALSRHHGHGQCRILLPVASESLRVAVTVEPEI